MAEQRDVQALAETVRAVLNKAAFGTETGPELLAALAALDGLVLEHTRQEEALRAADKWFQRVYPEADVAQTVHAALSPPPVASGGERA